MEKSQFKKAEELFISLNQHLQKDQVILRNDNIFSEKSSIELKKSQFDFIFVDCMQGEYEKVLQQEPNHQDAKANKALVEELKKQQEQEQKQIEKAFEILPTQQKEMLELRFLQGFSYQEIANNTGKSRQTIYNQIHTAIKKLRKILK